MTYNTLNLLDRLSVISLDKSFQKKTKLKFLVSSERLIHFIDHHTQFALLVRTLLRTYGGVFEQELTINIQLLKKKTGFNDSEVYSQLEALEKQGLLSAEFIKQDLSIALIPPREDKYTLNPLRKYIEQYQKNKLKKAQAVLDYLGESTKCLQGFILEYFGEKGFYDCGNCSNCIKNQNNAIKDPSSAYYKNIELLILEALNDRELNSREIIQNSKIPKAILLENLQRLLERGKIKLTTKNTYIKII